MSYFEAKLELEATDDVLISSFRKLNNFRDVCDILEVTPTHLHYILYKMKKEKRYHRFEIPKKGGGNREILAPCNSLRILQRKLNYIMSLIYKPKFVVHGYVKDRSIISNAKIHQNKNYILNFDIENFFPSINLGRIMGILKSFFGIGDSAAATIANICCFNNMLPQGAPTSPILSNMICFQLDKEMQLLAKKHHCVYTRYADDLTFSTKKKVFPKAIAYLGNDGVHLGKTILTQLESNGFSINHNKTRLHNKSQHLGVTGITVNEKLNVNRNYIKKIRAILRCLETNNLEKAQEIFNSKYRSRYKKNMSHPSIINVLRGMINYVGNVKDPNDIIFRKIASRYNKIVGEDVFSVDGEYMKFWTSHVYVIEIGIEDENDGFTPIEQGTGFFLQGVGFVTNAHVFKDFDVYQCNAIYINRSRYNPKKIGTSILKIDEDRDIAILKVDGFENNIGFSYDTHYYMGQKLTVLGYPNHGGLDSLYNANGEIVQLRSHFMENKYNKITGQLGAYQERIVISARIVVGNSGGPVVNSENKVVGIATKGFKEISPSSKDDSTGENMIVKIEDVLAFSAELDKTDSVVVES